MFNRRKHPIRGLILGLLVAGLGADRATSGMIARDSPLALSARATAQPTTVAALHATTRTMPAAQSLTPRSDTIAPTTSPTISLASRQQARLGTTIASQISTKAAQSTLATAPNATTLAAQAAATCPPLNGLLPVTPFYNYLRWRRRLNPARFDRNHPNIGPQLAADQEARDTPCPTPSPTPTPTPTPSPVPFPPPIPEPQILVPPGSPGGNNGGEGPPAPVPQGPPTPLGPPSPTGESVPEPSAIALFLIGLIAAPRLLRRHRPGRPTSG